MTDNEGKTRTDLIVSPVLEEPAEGSAVSKDMSGLFGLDSVALMNAKVSLLEALLNTLTKDYTFNEFVREILLAVMKVVKSEAGSFLEVDMKNQHLFFRAAVGTASDRLTDFTVPLGQGVVGHVVESRLPFVVSDAKENKIHLKSISTAVGFDVRNLVAAPVIIRGRVFGVLELINRVGERDYTPQDVELLGYITAHAAKVIETRMMISWAKQHAQSGKKAA